MTGRHRLPLTARQRRHRRLYPLLVAVGITTGLAWPLPPAGPPIPTCVAPECELAAPIPLTTGRTP